MEITKHRSGTFSWVDLATTNPAAAKAFYGELFGWSFADFPTGETGIYSMALLREKSVTALFEMMPAQRSQGIPPHWISYITVDSVDAAAARAKELGGKVLAEPFDVMTEGRMAVILDPGGAAFSLWEPRRHIGAQLMFEPGTLCWNELYTHDLDTCEAFYGKLFGWSASTFAGSPVPVKIFKNGATMAATMMAIQPAWGPMPPHWMVYFAVSDCDDFVARATAKGAKVMTGPQEIPTIGRFATLHDPQGAAFSVIKLAGSGS